MVLIYLWSGSNFQTASWSPFYNCEKVENEKQYKLLKDIKIVRSNWGINQDHHHVTMYLLIMESLLKMLWLSAMNAYIQRSNTIFSILHFRVVNT